MLKPSCKSWIFVTVICISPILIKRLSLLIVSLAIIFKVTYAQVGKVDTLFGRKGIVTADVGKPFSHTGSGRQVLLTADGSMYILIPKGEKTIVCKKKPDGSRDLSYGHNGFSFPIEISYAHAVLQHDGKIVVAGRKSEYYTTVDNARYGFSLKRINADGSLDKTFAGGNVVTHIAYYYDAANSIAIDKDGYIIVVGYSGDYDDLEIDSDNVPLYPNGHISIARYDGNGVLVSLVNETGNGTTKLKTNTAICNLATIQNDGKIVIAGTGDSGLVLARYNPDETIDTTFKLSDNLKINDSAYFIPKSLAVQNDGKIILGGSWQNINKDFTIVRYDLHGKLDTTFSDDGIATTDFRKYNDVITSISLQNDDKIVAAGYASNGPNYGFAVARYNSNGNLDSTFDSDGMKLTYSGKNDIFGNSVALQGDGRIVLAGYSNENIKLAKYNSDGSLDSSFGSKGVVTDSLKLPKTIFTSSAVQADGRIISVGYCRNGANYDFALARYLDNGRPDNTFSADGLQTTDFGADEFARAVVIQADGKILVAGDSAIARYNINGSLDITFNNTGKQISEFGISFTRLQKDGKIIVAGGRRLARYNSNGSPDVKFNGSVNLNPINITGIALQDDGKIITTGGAFEVVRYNADGSVDGSTESGTFKKIDFSLFYPDADFDNNLQYSTSVVVQNDGKIVVAGDAGGDERSGYYINTAIARYNSNGTLDSTFSASGMQVIFLDRNTKDPSILIQKDNKLIVQSTSYRNADIYYGKEIALTGYAFTRIHPNGSVDFDFGEDGREYLDTDNQVTGIAIGDNKLYITGYSETISEYGILTRYQLSTNNAPQVNFTAPAANATYVSPANITLTAAASVPGGSVKYVQFYNNGSLLATDSTSPFTYTIDNAPAGYYSFIAKATAGNTLTGNSASLSVSVAADSNRTPLVNITSPANNAGYPVKSTITINATATDPDGNIANVKFFNGSTLLKTDSVKPYDFTVTNASAGDYKFFVMATDNKGITSSSKTVCVYVGSTQANKTPVVTLSAPGNNAMYTSPASITLKASASDPDGTITSVRFYNGSLLLKTDSSSPYSYIVNNASAGNYTYLAQAIDNKGATNNSATVAVSVSPPVNKAPVVSISGPANNTIYYAPAAIKLDAVASDTDGTITSVAFFSGATVLKKNSTGPYTYTVKNVGAGNYSYTAKATDNRGLAGTSSTVHVTVLPNKAPGVYVNAAYSAYTVPPTILLSAGASDTDGTIVYVDFYKGATLLYRDSTSPYSFAWTNVLAGNYSFTAKATDNHGLYTISDTVELKFEPASTLEAEDAFLNGPVYASGAKGFTGYGYADCVHASGDYIEWTVDCSVSSSYILKFRYANAATNRPMKLEVNDVVVNPGLDFISTGGWSTWSVTAAGANLMEGQNKVRLTTIGVNGANLDNLSVTAGALIAGAKDEEPGKPVISSTLGSPGYPIQAGKKIVPTGKLSEQAGNFLSISVAPNPVSDHATLIMSGSSNLPFSVRLVDMLGRTLSSAKFVPDGVGVFDLPVYGVLPGYYSVMVKQGNLSTHTRLVIMNK